MGQTALFKPVVESLASLLGRPYIDAVVEAHAALTGRSVAASRKIAESQVDFFPATRQRAMVKLLGRVGENVSRPIRRTRRGAATRGFAGRTNTDAAPLSGGGGFRVGENGRLMLASKSEHYHAPLGHAFDGYRLIERARRLGIPNPTHNNTRGYITRTLEEQLVRMANGIAPRDNAALARTIRSRGAAVLNRVLNLQTGSLAAEAAIKMMLGRFYRVGADSPRPKYAGRTPVLIVMGDDHGAADANYHGTTIFAQMLRGMWPDLLAGAEAGGLMKVVAVRPNRLGDVEAAIRKYDRGRFKVAGFCHELVMMNYGGRVLDADYVQGAHRLCRRRDIPTLVDEIQTCLWAEGMFLFRRYGIRPTFVAVGKGFSGGEYAASRLLFNARMDCLPQFGALVTNGQEELASLAYLITMRWAHVNRPAGHPRGRRALRAEAATTRPQTSPDPRRRRRPAAHGLPLLCRHRRRQGLRREARRRRFRHLRADLQGRLPPRRPDQAAHHRRLCRPTRPTAPPSP